MASPKSYPLATYHFSPETSTFAAKTTHHPLAPNQILIRTTHSGICFTDVHALPKACGLGHEGVGHIEALGSLVTHFSLNDRVGWGWLHSSCGHCPTCVTGYRQYCSEARGFAFSDLEQGAFGDRRIIDAEFAYLIPEAISSVDAGPFMCAGASVYEALDAAGVRGRDRVGVYGVGGLGHMGVLFARAMGCGVTAISGKEGKAKEVLEGLGADEFRWSGEIETAVRMGKGGLEKVKKSGPMNINVLLITSNEVPDVEKLLPLLARRATIVLMTIQNESLTIPYMGFVLPGHRLIASTEASRENHIQMLEFAARHHIKPWTEQFPMDPNGLKAAFDRLQSGQMRYRGVLVKQNVGA